MTKENVVDKSITREVDLSFESLGFAETGLVVARRVHKKDWPSKRFWPFPSFTFCGFLVERSLNSLRIKFLKRQLYASHGPLAFGAMGNLSPLLDSLRVQ